MRLPSVNATNCSGEEVFHLKNAARSGDVLVRSDSAHSGLMHSYRICDHPQIQRPQMPHTMSEKAILLSHEFACHLEDGAGPLIEAFHQPIRAIQALRQI